MGANCTLYWIKLPEHTDIFSQGYVGITKQLLSKRFKEHKCGKSSIVSNAIAKYPECQIVPILVGSREYCLNIEFKLRPTDHIGWNIVPGGGAPPAFTKGHTPEAKAKISAASIRTCQSEARIALALRRKGVKRPPEFCKAMIESRKGISPWENSTANKNIWAIADEVYAKHVETGFGNINLEKLMGLPLGSLAVIVKKFKKLKWKPLDDPEWVKWASLYKEINKC